MVHLFALSQERVKESDERLQRHYNICLTLVASLTLSRVVNSQTRRAGTSRRLAVFAAALTLAAGATASAQTVGQDAQASNGQDAQAATDNKAQSAPPDLAPRGRGWEIGPYVGVARHSLVDTSLDLGLTPDRNHLFIGLHFTRELARPHNVVIAYAPEFVPLLLITNTPNYVTRQAPVSAVCGASCGVITYVIREVTEPVAGIAFSPIGIESRFPVAKRWSIFSAGAAGGALFTRAVPDMYGRRFNFTFEIGSGVRWSYGSRASLRLGFKFHHLSNAGTARRNPGIDGAVFMAGLDWAVGGSSRR